MKTRSRLRVALILFSVPFLLTMKVAAHCDALDGPVVETAKLAITKGDVTSVLKWVDKGSEKQIREAFALTMKVRTQGDDARKLADMHFFETLVRVHRAAEGEPFTGLKPAGTIDPGFQAADKALRDGTLDALSSNLTQTVKDGIRERFAAVTKTKKQADESVEAGRAYVAAYVDYAHFIEAIHTIAANKSDGHQQRHELH